MAKMSKTTKQLRSLPTTQSNFAINKPEKVFGGGKNAGATRKSQGQDHLAHNNNKQESARKKDQNMQQTLSQMDVYYPMIGNMSGYTSFGNTFTGTMNIPQQDHNSSSPEKSKK